MLVSIVIPAYNAAAFLDRAIESVLAQTYRHWELILVDNNSQDETLALMQNWAEREPERIRYYQEQKAGAPAARNRGLQLAKGEWIQFLDADDELLPEKLNLQLALLQKQPLLPAFIAGSYVKVLPDGILDNRQLAEEDSWVLLAKGQLGITSANFWQRQALQEVGGWEENRSGSQEAWLMFRLLSAGYPCLLDRQAQTLIHLTPGSISRGDQARSFSRFFELRAAIIHFLKQAASFPPSKMEEIYQPLFVMLRSWYRLQPKEAKEFFQTYYPSSFYPRVQEGINPFYSILYRFLGFPITDKLLSLVR